MVRSSSLFRTCIFFFSYAIIVRPPAVLSLNQYPSSYSQSSIYVQAFIHLLFFYMIEQLCALMSVMCQEDMV